MYDLIVFLTLIALGYGFGQHAAFPWDPSFPTKGQLNQKVAPVLHKDVASRRV